MVGCDLPYLAHGPLPSGLCAGAAECGDGPDAVWAAAPHLFPGGFDHGAGHPLLLLYDAKAPHGHNRKYFNDLLIYSSSISIGLF